MVMKNLLLIILLCAFTHTTYSQRILSLLDDSTLVVINHQKNLTYFYIV